MSRHVRVSRSGGQAGFRREREVDLDDGSPRAEAWADLLDSGRLLDADDVPEPDRFVYRVTADDGTDLVVHEQDLDADDRDLLEQTLRD
ncbi:MAG TPA: protealysin inhibitor emfourin [Nocardioidaceae bacterium]|nr:protealysin inhibitor emfourin [Nocardioidaceae bacterium]